MIDQIITLLGISNNYTFYAVMICGCVVIFFLMEFLFWISSLFHKLGGFK